MESSHQARVNRVQRALREAPLDYLFLSISPDLFYLTGFSTFVSERLFLLVVPPEGRPTMVVPGFERETVEPLSGWIDIAGWSESEDPVSVVRQSLAPRDRDRPLRIGISDHTYAVFLLRIQAALPGAHFVPASHILTPMRRVKDEGEMRILREAQALAVAALRRLFEGPFAGRTEKQVAADLRRHCEQVGLEAVLGPLVGSGPNGAQPHLFPTQRLIQHGEPVVIDFGAVHQGYYSDCTRTVHVGPPSAEFREVFDVVRRANDAALAAIRPGAACESVDRAARRVIEEAGFGSYFTHRLGHGIGIEVHEEPYMVEGNKLLLEPNMTFSDEPGIYLAGRFGCRLEDVVAVSAEGGVRLTDYTHEMLIVA